VTAGSKWCRASRSNASAVAACATRANALSRVGAPAEAHGRTKTSQTQNLLPSAVPGKHVCKTQHWCSGCQCLQYNCSTYHESQFTADQRPCPCLTCTVSCGRLLLYAHEGVLLLIASCCPCCPGPQMKVCLLPAGADVLPADSRCAHRATLSSNLKRSQ